MSLDTRILSLLASMELELDSGIAYQQRQNGGQQTGPPRSAFCTTPPSAVIRIRRFIKNVRKECYKEEQENSQGKGYFTVDAKIDLDGSKF